MVVDAKRLEMLLGLVGKCFASAVFFLENESAHRAKQRSWHTFERAMGAVRHARYSLSSFTGEGIASRPISVAQAANPPVRLRARGKP